MAINKIPVVEEVDRNAGQVGDVIQSILSEIEFQSIRGGDWVLMDGRSVAGSRYELITGNTNIPDARGQFLRGKNNGRVDGSQNPDGDLALGTTQGHAFGSHNHGGGSHAHAQRTRIADSAGGVFNVGFANVVGPLTNTETTAGPDSTVVNTQGGNETRPRNITINIFVKIN